MGGSSETRAVRPALHQYSLVDELIVTEPLVVAPTDAIGEVARLMTDRHAPCACVPLAAGGVGLVTDAALRRRVIVDGVPASAPVSAVVDGPAQTVALGESSAEALILMLEKDAEFLLVLDSAGALRGVITPRDFAVSSTTGGVSVHEQIRRASTVDELSRRASAVPSVLSDLLRRGLSTDRVVAVYSSILDTVVRRALVLTFRHHPDLSTDAFTWLSLGSSGRREAVLSSDLDSAVAFDDSVTELEIDRYRTVFAEVDLVLSQAGLVGDAHGATARRVPFSRTNASWRAAALEWLAAPEVNQGAIMTSLLVDGRPIYGDRGVPAVLEVFGDLRAHPGTMRLLMQQALANRARGRMLRDIVTRRETFDVKAEALLPIVNVARWAALTVGSAALPTRDRLRAAAGSAMLPEHQALNVIEAFDVLQRLRLRRQLAQYDVGERPTDVWSRAALSPIDRSMLAQAVREIAAVQHRMDNIAVYLPAESWTAPG